VVYEKVISSHVNNELPFMATENILMECVMRGGDRQDLHERIREHSMAAANQVKTLGSPNDLIERIIKDSSFKMDKGEIESILNPKNFIGRAPNQVTDFIENIVNPILKDNKDLLGVNSEVLV